jgi:hypothetical protein
MACKTLQSIPELTLEEVDNEAVVSHPINLPFLIAGNLLWQPLQLSLPLCRWLPSRLM